MESINNIKLNSNYGTEYKTIGETANGRIIYELTDKHNSSVKKVTIPAQNKDQFEKTLNKANKQVKRYPPDNQLQAYKDIQILTLGGAVVGAGLTSALTNMKSKLGRFFIIGSGTAFGAAIAIGTWTGIMFSRLLEFLNVDKKLDVQPYQDENNNNNNNVPNIETNNKNSIDNNKSVETKFSK